MQKRHRLAEMTRLEVAERLQSRPVAILPLGATEQHGHHLPLGTDTYLADEYALRLAQEIDGIVLPAIPFGYSWVWQDLPGTVTVGHRELEDYLRSVIESVERSGYGMLVLVNGHESNRTTMKYVVRDYAARSNFQVVRIFYPRMAEVREQFCSSPTWRGMIHACEFETSLMLATREDLVDMSLAVAEYPDSSTEYVYGAEQLGNISDSGVFGDAVPATRDKGEAMLARFVAEAVSIVREFQASASQERVTEASAEPVRPPGVSVAAKPIDDGRPGEGQ